MFKNSKNNNIQIIMIVMLVIITILALIFNKILQWVAHIPLSQFIVARLKGIEMTQPESCPKRCDKPLILNI